MRNNALCLSMTCTDTCNRLTVMFITCTGDILDQYKELGHPYVADFSISTGLSWVLSMSPIMSTVLGEAEFVEVDVTYKAAVEFDYLLNMVAFHYSTLRCKCTLVWAE